MSNMKTKFNPLKTQIELRRMNRQIHKEIKTKAKTNKSFFQGMDKLERRHKIAFYLIIGTAIIMFWRGIWNLTDEYLIPESFLFSNVLSIVGALLILGASEYMIKYLA